MEGTAGAGEAPWLCVARAAPSPVPEDGTLRAGGAPRGIPRCPANLRSFGSEQREAKGSAEEERRSL